MGPLSLGWGCSMLGLLIVLKVHHKGVPVRGHVYDQRLLDVEMLLCHIWTLIGLSNDREVLCTPMFFAALFAVARHGNTKRSFDR